jgi:VIT1/CCC1 family predicted Fe2+/Mn2+ transporter
MHEQFPDAERAELAERFVSYGADEQTAQRMSAAVSSDADKALQFHAREELGVDPDDLPSPLVAGGASLVAFSLGAILPLLPYLLGLTMLWPAMVIAGIALLVGGMVVGRLTGRSLLRAGIRQLLLGALAVVVTFGVGQLIGTSVAP